MSLRSTALFFFLAAGSLSLPASAPRIQSMDAPWRTITTAHYRIHFPDQPEFKVFAENVGSRIEGIHGVFQTWIGHARQEITDIVVQNPLSMPNGMAISLLSRPHVVLWTEPPDSDTEISHERDWQELLVTHELVHLHHLTIPDRKPRWFERMPGGSLRQSAVARKSPVWVVEGFATLLEGKLTGSGRPHGAYRAMVLRERARQGSLLTYERLGEMDRAMMSAPRYMVGSAFLEWLERSKPGQPLLQDLWKRLSSPRYPRFDGAFRATFGLHPKEAYQRFCAELTHDALELERRLKASGLREGEIWGHLPNSFLRDLSVGPDGSRVLAQVLNEKDSGLRIWDLKTPLENEKARAKEAKQDPDLPPEVPEAFPVRKAEHNLGRVQFMLPCRPQWSPGGEVRYEILRADHEGVFHWQTDTWNPLPQSTGEPMVQLLRPRIGKGSWSIEVDGKSLTLPFEPFGPLSWDRSHALLYASTPVQGILNVVRLSFDPKAERPFGEIEILTRTATAAAYPAPTPDGKTLYFALLTGKGSQIRKLDLALTPLSQISVASSSEPFAPDLVTPKNDEPTRLPAPGPVPASHPYQIGESHVVAFRSGFVFSPSGRSLLVGAGGSDILGRLEWVALGAIDLPSSHGMGPRGATAGAAWRGWAWHPSMQVFSDLEKPSAQLFVPVSGWDRERGGAGVAVERIWPVFPFQGGLKFSLGMENVAWIDSLSLQRRVALAAFNQDAAFNRGNLALAFSFEGRAAWGRTEGAWSLQRAAFDVKGRYDWGSLAIRGEGGRIQGSPSNLDHFHVGGQSADLVPESLEANRIWQPALPVVYAAGDRFTRWRAEGFDFLYVEGTAVWNEQQGRPVFQRVAGLEVKGNLADSPILGDITRRILGRAQVSLGLHRPLDGPMKDRTVFTMGMTYRY